MRVVLTSFGSTGDIYPMIALGRALLDAGHEAAFATAPLFRKPIEDAGLDYIETPPHWSEQEFAGFMRDLDNTFHPLRQLRAIYKGALEHVPELIERLSEALEDADLLVTSYMFPQFGSVAQRQGVPFATFSFCHNFIPTPHFPPAYIPQLRGVPGFFARPYNLFWWRAVEILVDSVINGVMKPLIRNHSVHPARGFLSRPADLSIVCMSPYVGRSRGILDPRFRFVGYLRWQAAHNPVLEDELRAFCKGEKVPVLTFGSVAFNDPDRMMRRFAQRWPRNKKIIIQRGWAGLNLTNPPKNIKIIDAVSHDQLFRHASCVIHHGGAGTTASVLHAGKPHIVVPHIADQPFFAREVRRLGVGISVSKHRWPEALPRAVKKVTRRKRFLRKARWLAETLKRENGRREAVRTLEDYVARYQKQPAEDRQPAPALG